MVCVTTQAPIPPLVREMGRTTDDAGEGGVGALHYQVSVGGEPGGGRPVQGTARTGGDGHPAGELILSLVPVIDEAQVANNRGTSGSGSGA